MLYVCMYVCMYVYVYVHVHVHVYVYVSVCVCLCIYIYVYVYVYALTDFYMPMSSEKATSSILWQVNLKPSLACTTGRCPI